MRKLSMITMIIWMKLNIDKDEKMNNKEMVTD